MSKKKNLGDLITENKENAEELSAADIKVTSDKDNIEKKISKLILENEQNSEELSAIYKIIAIQEKEIKKQAEAIILANKEKEKRKADLLCARKELVLAKEKEKLAVELTIVNKELTHQIEKRKQTELALMESIDKYIKAFRSSPYSITISRLDDGKYIEVNDNFVTLTGFTREEALSTSEIGINIWVNKEERNSVISALLSGKDIEGKEFQFRKKNGEIIFCLFYAKIIYSDKEPLMIASVDDITERKQADKLLKDSEQKSMSIMENSADAIFITNQQGKYVYTNKAVTALLGFTSEEMVNKTILDISPSDEREEYINFFKQIMIEGKGFTEIKLLKKDGNYISTDLNTVLLPDGTIYGSCRDITQRKQAELELIKAKEKAEENEYNLNERVKELAGLYSLGLLTEKFENLDDIYNELVKIIIPNSMQFPDKVYVALEIAHKKYINIENFNLSKSNVTLSTPLKIFGTHSGTLTVSYTENLPFIEIYEQNLINAFGERISKIYETDKILQDLIISKEKAEESDRLKTAFLCNISHEIRTPMNGILGFAELLREPDLSSEDQQNYIQTIQSSGVRMLNTINSIIDMSKIESGLKGVDIKETNINEHIEFTYKLFKPEVESKGLKFLYKNGLPTNESIIKTDNEKVYEILINLVRNAIKFTQKGSIEFGYILKSDSEPAELEFFIKDTGIGIPPKQHQIIFERFRQVSESHNRGYEGSGLGLSISKSYVEMLGGKIWVESEEGLGSTFYFTIPYNPVSASETKVKNGVSAELKEVQIRNLKILIVEDDEISYSLLSRMLKKVSEEVLHAISGVQAVEACRNNPDLDLILMDIRMPNMDGNEATRQIRLFNKEIIIIAQTAYAFDSDREKAINSGCNEIITKPISNAILLALIKKHFKI